MEYFWVYLIGFGFTFIQSWFEEARPCGAMGQHRIRGFELFVVILVISIAWFIYWPVRIFVTIKE